MKKNIIINLQYEAIHSWQSCNMAEVAFLKHPHRHIFCICCKKEVEHNEREIEIIMFKRLILDYLVKEFKGDFKNMSCESLAERLLKDFELSYCSVLEDGENGAEVTQ